MQEEIAGKHKEFDIRKSRLSLKEIIMISKNKLRHLSDALVLPFDTIEKKVHFSKSTIDFSINNVSITHCDYTSAVCMCEIIVWSTRYSNGSQFLS